MPADAPLPDLDEPNFTVEFELTGEQVSSLVGPITGYSLNSEFTTQTDGWSFTVYSEDNPAALRRKFRPWQPVKLYIDGELQVVGRIERTRGDGESGSALVVEGYDYLYDLGAGGIDPQVRFAANMTLQDAVLAAVKPYGITSLEGSNITRNLLTGKNRFNGTPARDFRNATLQEFKPGDNDSAWQVCEKILARHGFTMQPAPSRDRAVIAAPDYEQDPTFGLKRPGNILRGTATRDYSPVPTVTVATGRQGKTGEKASGMRKAVSTFGKDAPSRIGDNPEVKNIAFSPGGTTPTVIDFRFYPTGQGSSGVPGNNGLLYRPMFYRDKDSRNQEQFDRGLRRMIADRLRSTLEYRCTLRGHRDPKTGAVYAVDTMAHVEDEIEDVNEVLWCVERTFTNSGHGPLTELVFIRPEAFQL